MLPSTSSKSNFKQSNQTSNTLGSNKAKNRLPVTLHKEKPGENNSPSLDFTPAALESNQFNTMSSSSSSSDSEVKLLFFPVILIIIYLFIYFMYIIQYQKILKRIINFRKNVNMKYLWMNASRVKLIY